MANRVLLGKRGSDYGLFVSQKDIDVTNTALTTPLSFDSRAVRGLCVALKGEGTLAAPSGGQYTTTGATLSHGLGYKPAFAVRWAYVVGDMNGASTEAIKMRQPSVHYHYEEFDDDDGQMHSEEVSMWSITTQKGCSVYLDPSSPHNLTIYNKSGGTTLKCETDMGGCPTEYNNSSAKAILYTYVIFQCKDFTGGVGL